MMQQLPSSRFDPARHDPAMDAAALLRRMGFVTLMMALPLAALVSRRAVVVLAPIGIALLVLASVLDNGFKPLRKALKTPLQSWTSAALAVLLGWAVLSLLWTPFPAAAAERLGNIFITLFLALAGYLSLPERVRAANLYLAPIGVAGAALLAIFAQIFGLFDARLETEGTSLWRGLIVLSLFTWPAVTWLCSRKRLKEALGVLILSAFSLLVGGHGIALVSFLIAGVVFVCAFLRPAKTFRSLALVLAGCLVIAPLLPFIMKPFEAWLGLSVPLGLWRETITSEPFRLITGHGFETALRGRALGLLPQQIPSSILFEIWYELGLVGVCAASFALVYAVKSLETSPPPVFPVSSFAPGVAATLASAFVLAASGVATTQSWWITTLAVLVVCFASAERAQYTTRRPKALFLALPAPSANPLHGPLSEPLPPSEGPYS
jgi:hypothetical protein